LVVEKFHSVLSVLLIFAPFRLHDSASAIDKVPAIVDEDILALLIVILEGVLVIG
jgi:hypothetical protein